MGGTERLDRSSVMNELKKISDLTGRAKSRPDTQASLAKRNTLSPHANLILPPNGERIPPKISKTRTGEQSKNSRFSKKVMKRQNSDKSQLSARVSRRDHKSIEKNTNDFGNVEQQDD
jgi:hypothetical protein